MRYPKEALVAPRLIRRIAIDFNPSGLRCRDLRRIHTFAKSYSQAILHLHQVSEHFIQHLLTMGNVHPLSSEEIARHSVQPRFNKIQKIERTCYPTCTVIGKRNQIDQGFLIRLKQVTAKLRAHTLQSLGIRFIQIDVQILKNRSADAIGDGVNGVSKSGDYARGVQTRSSFRILPGLSVGIYAQPERYAGRSQRAHCRSEIYPGTCIARHSPPKKFVVQV